MAKSVDLGDFGTVRISLTGQSQRALVGREVVTVPVLLVEGTQLDKGYPTPWFAEVYVAGDAVKLGREEGRSAHFNVYPEYRGKLTKALQRVLRR